MTLTAAPEWVEHAARQFTAPPRRWDTPGQLAQHLNPRTRRTPALDLIDQALVDLAGTPDGRLIISMPPQEGKSVRVAGDFPTWLLTQNPDLRIVTASYGQALANRNGRAIRARVTNHPGLGLGIAPDNGSVHEWQIAGRAGGVLSVGIGAGVTGRPADFFIIDDPIKDRKEANSKVYRDGVWDWWTDSASTRLAPGAQVVLILTRWHYDDLAGRLVAAEDGHLWRVLNIPAQAGDGPGDPLGRAPGEWMISARGRTPAQWEATRTRVGTRTWEALYQGNPTPEQGGVWQAGWWDYYDHAPWVERADGTRVVPFLTDGDELAQSWDLTFKDTKGSDYVVGQVWLRRGAHAWLLDQVRGRWDFVETCRRMLGLTARWPQAVLKLVEDKANGPAVLNSLRSQVGGLVPVEPEGSKYARAAAVAPLIESGNAHIPSVRLAPWVAGLVDEARDFPAGAHDDQVDATSQALHRLLLVPILRGDLVEPGDILDDDLDLAWTAANF